MWQPRLFSYLGLDRDPRFQVNYDKSNNMRSKKVTNRKRRYGIFDFQPNSETNASNHQNLLKYYDRESFNIIVSLYKQDIILFDYDNEVKKMSELFI